MSDKQAVILRPYQEAIVIATLEARKRGVQRSFYCAPTGTGKTHSFVALHNRWPVSGKTLVLAHREELLGQIADALREANPGVWVETERGCRKANPGAEVVVASVQTLGRESSQRLEWLRSQLRLVIVDEAHHAPAASYRRVFNRFGCFTAGGPALIGCTATPKRLDRVGLDEVFQEQVFAYPIRQAIEDGWVCDIRGVRIRSSVNLDDIGSTAGDFNPNELAKRVNIAPRTQAAVEEWSSIAAERPTLAFCVDIEHAQSAAEMWRSYGVAAECVHSGLSPEERSAVLNRFRLGLTRVLTNVQILTEGFDHPPVSCVVMLRPTQSWSLYCQCVGRGTRIHPGKPDCLVIDVVDNCAKHALGSVPALLDLPADLNLQGRSLLGMSRLIEAITTQSAQPDPAMLANLARVLEEFDVLTGLRAPRAPEPVGQPAVTSALSDAFNSGSAPRRSTHAGADFLKLNLKQRRFVNFYVGAANGNATKAAKLAGYSERTAYAIGAENLQKPGIRAAINALSAGGVVAQQ
jgi:superfamily II DNA or RNA helicase